MSESERSRKFWLRELEELRRALVEGLAERDDLRANVKALKEALGEAPDMTCESPEARAWRKKHRAVITPEEQANDG